MQITVKNKECVCTEETHGQEEEFTLTYKNK